MQRSSSSRKHQRKPWLTSIRLFSQQQPHVTRRFRRPLVVARLRRPLSSCCATAAKGPPPTFFTRTTATLETSSSKKIGGGENKTNTITFRSLGHPIPKRTFFPLPLLPLSFYVMKLFPQTWLLIFCLSLLFLWFFEWIRKSYSIMRPNKFLKVCWALFQSSKFPHNGAHIALNNIHLGI